MHELTTPGTVSRSDLRGRWRLALPAIAAPMFLVSGYDLVLAACTAGVVGAFPTVNVGDGDTLRTFLSRLGQALEGGKAAPACPNRLSICASWPTCRLKS